MWAAAYFTGGFGLLGAEGAGAGAAAAEGAAAATSATSVGATVAANAAPAAVAAEGMAGLSAGEAALLSQAQAAAAAPITTAATEAAATPWYQSAWTWAKANKDVIGIGVSGMGAVMGGVSSHNQAVAQENALKLQSASDALDLATRERDSQERLRNTLASQQVYYSSLGVNASEGSALSAAEAARGQAERELSLYSAYGGTQASAYGMKRRMAARAKSGAYPGALLDFGVNVYDRMA